MTLIVNNKGALVATDMTAAIAQGLPEGVEAWTLSLPRKRTDWFAIGAVAVMAASASVFLAACDLAVR